MERISPAHHPSRGISHTSQEALRRFEPSTEAREHVLARKIRVGPGFHAQFRYDRVMTKLTNEERKLFEEVVFLERSLLYVGLVASLADSIAPSRPEAPTPIRFANSGFREKPRPTQGHAAVGLGGTPNLVQDVALVHPLS
jgi:hypothetical protein